MTLAQAENEVEKEVAEKEEAEMEAEKEVAENEEEVVEKEVEVEEAKKAVAEAINEREGRGGEGDERQGGGQGGG